MDNEFNKRVAAMNKDEKVNGLTRSKSARDEGDYLVVDGREVRSL